jgi:HK97 family phage prohead protease
MSELLKKRFGYKVKDIDETGIVTIYVNAFGNVDSDNEISAPGSFDKTIRENFKRIKHLKDHDTWKLLGLPLEFIPDGYGLLVRSAMNMKKEMVRDVYEDYKFFMGHDRTIEHSIGYRVMQANLDNNTGIRTITEYKLMEYSTLSFLGANENTPCVDVKSQQTKLESDIRLLDEMLRKGNYTDEKFMNIEKKVSEIQLRITEMKSLNQEEPLKDTLIIEPNPSLEEKKLDYKKIITNLNLK